MWSNCVLSLVPIKQPNAYSSCTVFQSLVYLNQFYALEYRSLLTQTLGHKSSIHICACVLPVYISGPFGSPAHRQLIHFSQILNLLELELNLGCSYPQKGLVLWSLP